jgi:hypothetical protein
MASLASKIIKYVNAEVDFNSDVILQDDMVNGVSNPYIKEWNLNIAQPTDAQLSALESDADKMERNNQVIATRKNLYGSWDKQLEEINEQGLDAWKERIAQIKIDNPKE